MTTKPFRPRKALTRKQFQKIVNCYRRCDDNATPAWEMLFDILDERGVDLRVADGIWHEIERIAFTTEEECQPIDREEEALKQYLENLWRRHHRKDFSGLPDWQSDALKDCNKVLSDELCKVCKVLKGSTVGHSVRYGDHYADISLF